MASFHDIGLIVIFAAAVAVFPLLFFVPAPYGRHLRRGWGPTIPARLGWIVMEAPSPLMFAAVYFSGPGWDESAPLILMSMWMGHYIWRSFIFPFHMRMEGKRKPLLTVVMAIIFNVVNGGINAYAISYIGYHLDASWLADPRFIAGLALFLVGVWINQSSDAHLRRLRAPGETGYRIPHKGLHRYVASPNYFGEIIEWTGFAIAAWTTAGLAFAVFTFANLAPRAFSHRAWYRDEFPDYPKERKALIPKIW